MTGRFFRPEETDTVYPAVPPVEGFWPSPHRPGHSLSLIHISAFDYLAATVWITVRVVLIAVCAA